MCVFFFSYFCFSVCFLRARFFYLMYSPPPHPASALQTSLYCSVFYCRPRFGSWYDDGAMICFFLRRSMSRLFINGKMAKHVYGFFFFFHLSFTRGRILTHQVLETLTGCGFNRIFALFCLLTLHVVGQIFFNRFSFLFFYFFFFFS